METERIGQRIREIRTGKGIKVKELAERTELTSSHISQIERGMANPSLGTIEKIAQALDIPLVALFSDVKERPALVKADKRTRIELDDAIVESLMPGTIPDWPVFMYITGIDDQRLSRSVHYSHEGYEMVFVLEGSIRWHVADKVYDIEKGDTLCYDARSTHWGEGSSDDLKLLVMNASRHRD